MDDRQAPRLSYVANEAIMPRKKYCVSHDNTCLSTPITATPIPAQAPPTVFANYDISAHVQLEQHSNLCQVQEDEITSPATTILVAEFSQNPACIYRHLRRRRPRVQVPPAGQRRQDREHAEYDRSRAVNGLPMPAATDYRLFDGEEYDTNQQWQFYKLTVTDAMNDINCVTNGQRRRQVPGSRVSRPHHVY